MNLIRSGLYLGLLLLAFGCGSGGESNDSGGGTAVCLNCAGLSGNARLLCEIQNSNTPGCDQPPDSNLSPNAISAFSFTSPAVSAVFGSGDAIYVTVPFGTNVAALVANFGLSGPSGASVAVGGTAQSSGITANDFAGPVTYTVTSAEGKKRPHIVSVAIAPPTNIWTWVGGSDLTNQNGIYGTKGASADANTPGARHDAVSWTDPAGIFWLFGGRGFDSVGALDKLNDLWKFDGIKWTWINGSNLANQIGIYGTKGTTAATSIAGAREVAASSTDTTGNLWLFGGYGLASSGPFGLLNDLWKFDGISWTWVSGSNLANQIGIYGTKGTAAATNIPGARQSAVSWTDANGNFWLFGGSDVRGELNDLWKFDGSNWTWVSGSNLPRPSGTYGIKGTAAANNVPGARQKGVTWTDSAGLMWLFGGTGYASQGRHGVLNDLWKFDGANWTWVGGSDLPNQTGTYGSNGMPATAVVPAARSGAASWADSTGNRWVFGGYGVGINGPLGSLNDLWKFDGTFWTFVGASGYLGQYGPKGMATTAFPYARSSAVTWTDTAGKLWLFGGRMDSTGKLLNDLMLYQP